MPKHTIVMGTPDGVKNYTVEAEDQEAAMLRLAGYFKAGTAEDYLDE